MKGFNCLPRYWALFSLLLYSLCSRYLAVAGKNFERCATTSFCNRYDLYIRAILASSNQQDEVQHSNEQEKKKSFHYYSVKSCALGRFPYQTGNDTATSTEESILCSIYRREDNFELKLVIRMFAPGILRLQMHENACGSRRYSSPENWNLRDSALSHLQCGFSILPCNNCFHARAACPNLGQQYLSDNGLTFADFSHLMSTVRDVYIHYNPFSIETFVDGYTVHRINSLDGLHWESFSVVGGKHERCHLKESGDMLHQERIQDTICCDESKAECYTKCPSSSTHPRKYKRPQAVGVDIEFVNSVGFYGLFEHATNLMLPFTEEPYRLYNLDVYGYPLYSPAGLYASIPFLSSLQNTQNSTSASGMLWNNPADTWVKLFRHNDSVYSWWLSETGLIDIFLFLGASPLAVLQQYHITTGFSPLHPMFALGKHQSRWNYFDEEDIKSLDQQMDIYGIPYESIWLDIEYAVDKEYFRWNLDRFPNPEELASYLQKQQRYLVVIVDPHIHVSKDYAVYNQAIENKFFMKKSDGSPFQGQCWPPGDSIYPDVSNPRVKQWFADLYSKHEVISKCPNLFIWNDMNEPSVFDAKEMTFPKSAINYQDIPLRAIHNEYALHYVEATFMGLMQRNASSRPFILSRSGYTSVQKYAFLWTGDNFATWRQLRISIPMILSAAMTGISAIGADVGGFVDNPTGALLSTWHLLGIWYPFYREHSHFESMRRDPWLWGSNVLESITEASLIRYRLIYYWYRLLAEYALGGIPMIRPLWWMDLEDRTLLDLESSYLVGNEFLIHPINLEKGRNLSTFLPHPPQGWYDYWNKKFYLPGHLQIRAYQKNVAVFVAAGSIIPEKTLIRRSSGHQFNDPFQISVYLTPQKGPNDVQTAKGKVYLDDLTSFNFTKNEFVYGEFQFEGNVFRYQPLPLYNVGTRSLSYGLDKSANNGVIGSTEVTKLVIYGLAKKPEDAHLVLRNQLTLLDSAAYNDAQTWTFEIDFPSPIRFNEIDWHLSITFKQATRPHYYLLLLCYLLAFFGLLIIVFRSKKQKVG